jgi:predicted RNase H-like HicB family nuclease
MQRYFGIIDQNGGIWGVTIPDIAGAVGAGSTLEEAIDSATVALREIAQHLVSGGYDLPAPSSFADVLATGEWGANPPTVLIPLLLDSGRTVRANLTFDAGLLAAIDQAAKLRGLTRSAFLASAARDKIGAGGVV